MTSENRNDKADRERRRRKLDAVFGKVLPDITSDERDTERPQRDSDTWYEENRPPHHDR
ncbi:hypothetical protein ORV05_01345 [Amycolatopsis cynarae]|uniref:Uncharacterized protein n=1 Tax=Amycolatopsis cynarae TaxID=2995223 RepID=A0ABY7B3J5_9PSEU|nr:hypothetical protein [Amycolatopsis sp. HUAS 11-8]WAL66492.1 hypothetical protein ORV05_01345 [Amycolatopsis sp. HUAS 11-8]